MPSQIVTLPLHVIKAIDAHAWFHRAHAFGLRELELIAAGSKEKSPAFRVFASPASALHRSPYAELAYAVLLQAPGCTLAPPRPLPEATELLQLAEAALLDLPHLSSHDQMEILSAFAAAHDAVPVPRVPRRRSPATAYEHRLIARAVALQTTLTPVLKELGRKLARYQRLQRQSGLEITMSRLDLQAELGAKLTLTPIGRLSSAGLHSPSRRGSLESLVRSTHCQIETFKEIAETIDQADDGDEPWLTSTSLQTFHGLFLPACRQAGYLRESPAQIASPFDGSVRELSQPAVSLPSAIADLVATFDPALWRDIHPLIRASLLHTELVRLHPYRDANGRLARLLVLGTLFEAGLPALPLMTVFEWNRHTYLQMVDRAVVHGDDLGWVQFCLKATFKAMSLGQFFMQVLSPQVACFEKNMRAQGDSPAVASKLAGLAASMVLGPDPQLAHWGYSPLDCEWRFDRSGLVDGVDAGGLNVGIVIADRPSSVLWSHPIARYLLHLPLARL